MRVLFWSGTFWPSIGGVQVLASKLLPSLENRGYHHLVVTEQGHGIPNQFTHYKGISIHRFSFWNSMANVDQLMQIRKQVAQLISSFAPDIIHINGVGRSDFFYHLTAEAYPAPLVVTLHGPWLPEAELIVGRTLRKATWVVGCSSSMIELGRKLIPKISPRSSVIHNALVHPTIPSEPLPTDIPHILCLGRLNVQKGFDLALAAFSLLLSRFPKVRLTIAGDGPERTQLQKQARELGITERVNFIGKIYPKKVFALINTATMVVMPSRQELFGLVALEAALMARPVVATRVGGLPEVIVHGETGLLVEPDNVSTLAKAIEFLLEHPKMAEQMGQVGQRLSQENFRWEEYVDAYESLYKKVLARPKSDRLEQANVGTTCQLGNTSSVKGNFRWPQK